MDKEIYKNHLVFINHVEDQIKFTPQHDSKINSDIKHTLKNFNNFNETQNYNISSVNINIEDAQSLKKSEITTFPDKNHLLTINNYNDLVGFIGLMKTHKLSVRKISFNIEIKTADAKELNANFIKCLQLIDNEKQLKYAHQKFILSDTIKSSNLLSKNIKNILLRSLELDNRAKIGLFAKSIYYCMSPFLTFFAKRTDLNSVSKEFFEINKAIEDNSIYKDILGLKVDVTAAAEINQFSSNEYIDKKREKINGEDREIYIVTKPIIDPTTKDSNIKAFEQEKLDYRVLHQDTLHNVTSFLTGEPEANIIRGIMDNKQKDHKSEIEKLKKARVKRAVTKDEKSQNI